MAKGRKPPISKRKRLLSILSLLLSIGLAEYWIYPVIVSPSGLSRDQGRNGLWLRYKWYFGENTDFDGLAGRLNHGRFRYAFFHVRFIDENGSLHFKYLDQARRLNNEMRSRSPGTL